MAGMHVASNIFLGGGREDGGKEHILGHLSPNPSRGYVPEWR